jgi:hypothetical protein
MLGGFIVVISSVGGMMMHPQTKHPWSFQPWTMSLSGQYVPRVKLINGFHVLSIFFSLNVASQPTFSLYGDFLTILNFQTMIIILVIVSPFATPMDFYRGKNCQNLNSPYIILQKYLLVRFCNIILRKFANQNML